MFKSIFIMFSLLITSSVFANAYQYKCSVKHNSDVDLETEFAVEEDLKKVVVAEFDEYKFFFSRLGDNQVEIQSYNSSEESRSYATGKMRETSDFVELAIWKRDSLLSVRCSQL